MSLRSSYTSQKMSVPRPMRPISQLQEAHKQGVSGRVLPAAAAAVPSLSWESIFVSASPSFSRHLVVSF